ncbi:MAG: hypothetical protein RJB14_2399 [Pseudomonadota bacterium]|jgi:Tfp pilus assembly protein PilN
MQVFNLLHYPALAAKRRRFHRRWTSWTGLVVGGLVAVGLLTLVQEKRVYLANERAALEARGLQVQKKLSVDKALEGQQHIWQQQEAHIQWLRGQQRRWEVLHQALMRETGPDTVQLRRLQFESHTLELHGQAKDVQRMDQSRTRLSSLLADSDQDTRWALVSLVHAPEAGGTASAATLEFVWRVAWPQMGSGPVSAPAAATSRERP